MKNRNVTLATSFICKGIGKSSVGSSVGVHVLLVCYTTNEEFGTILVEEVRALIYESTFEVTSNNVGWTDSRHTLMTIGGRSAAAADDAKSAPVNAAAAAEAKPKVFMMLIEIPMCVCYNVVFC